MTASPSDRTRRFVEGVAPGAGALLRGGSVEIVADVWTAGAEIVVALLTTLLLRLETLCPVIHLRVPASRSRELPRLNDGPLIEAVALDHAGFESLERLTETPADGPAVRLVIGGSGDNGISVDVDGWRVGLRARTGRCEGIPAVAAFGGVLAANEVLQQLLQPVVDVRPCHGMVSLWDLDVDGADGRDVGVVDLDRVAFAACGGVASATGWALALHQLNGQPRLVDPDAIDHEGTNLNRHLTASFRDVDVPKVKLLGSMLDGSGARSDPSIGPWTTECAQGIDVVVATPDHDAVRRQVQLDLPRVVLAGGTGDKGTYQVARHGFLDHACACCLWRADLTDASPLDGVARALGLPRALLDPFTESRAPLPEDVLAQVGDESVREGLRAVSGCELVEHVCATIRVSAAAPAVSAPMLAAAPGVLLATELIKERLSAPTPLRAGANTVTASILAAPHHRWARERAKRVGCECTDELYAAHYRRKWGHG